jgi:hypothetical protein
LIVGGAVLIVLVWAAAFYLVSAEQEKTFKHRADEAKSLSRFF